MLMSVGSIFLLVLTAIHGQVLLYNTENKEMVEKFDCVYKMYDDGEEIPYCRRSGEPQLLKRKKNECDNGGEKQLFHDLLKQEIHPSIILKWSSSVEMADSYARVFYNRSLIDDNDDRFLCNCTTVGTFGIYCKYQLTHEAKTFSEAIQKQFQQKNETEDDSWNTQRYGKILCYETLPCDSGPLCLDWREICDGVQRCLNGIDEENWDKLEFNECEDDEFRCSNGMCIPEQFWLDGDLDCMDWSDEYFTGYHGWCSFEARSLECDEHLCMPGLYSCGDGDCIQWFTRMAFQRIGKAVSDCFTKRNLNYMCEVSPHHAAWTLESGLCWPDQGYDDPRYPPWNMMNASKLSDNETCFYLFRCAWSKGFEHDCPCNHQNCTELLINVCSTPDHLIIYPPQGLINSNLLFFYDYRQPMENPQCKFIRFIGNLRCRGFLRQLNGIGVVPLDFYLINRANVNYLICGSSFPPNMYQDFSSSFPNDLFCWNDSLTFNGRRYAVDPDICPSTRECISQYRIHDSKSNCLSGEDEFTIIEKNYCTGNIGRQRFQCFNDQHKCLVLNALGSGSVDCSNKYDESYFGIGASLQTQLPCQKSLTAECHRVKEYIQRSSLTNSSNNTQLIHSQIGEETNGFRFQWYCDSFWDLKKHLDEIPSSCQYWVCQNDQYQCRTGQCIQLTWVCDGEWDCADASDEEGIELIKQWSGHNAALPKLLSQVEKCGKLYSKSPFSGICNRSFQLGCYLSEVGNPLDIRLNHPCINLTQIGDGVEDCFNAYDERNTFIANSDQEDMWGFHFRCKDTTLKYVDACNLKMGKNCSEILCSFHRNEDGSCSDRKDWICLEDDHCKKGARCNGIVDCTNGEDEYWCPTGSLPNQIDYRFDKKIKGQNLLFDLATFPGHFLISDQQHVMKRMINSGGDSPWKIHSYQCNRGVAVLQSNETQCLCPPAYYGRWCEFYSDRISIIAHLNHSTLPKTLSNVTLKIKTNFLYNNWTIDHYQFNVIPTLERSKIIKHRFYLLYSRSKEMIEHKRNHYSNRTDVISHHPYSVHFDVFLLEENRSVKELGSWYYPIYFDYLPAFRLAIVLRFPSWFGNVTIDPCRESDCNANSSCLPVLNQNNSYYCSCNSGYYGKNCDMYKSQCDTSCSVDGFCEVDSLDLQVGEKEVSCICPLGYFGSGCHLKFDQCDENSCLNSGICFSTYDQSGEEPFLCNCSERFEEKRCEVEKLSIHVHLNMTRSLSTCPTVVQLYNHMNYFLRLYIEHQQVYRQLPSVIKYYGLKKATPTLGILKVYEHWSNPQYFVMYMYTENQHKISITSSPQLCPHALSLLSKEIDQSVPAVFQYHYICQNNTEQFCFYDQNYLCICQSNHYRVHCFTHDNQLDHCDKCLSGGKCLQGNPKDGNDFTCFCPSCYQGHRCQFSFQAFGFTLDSLLIDQSKEVKIVYVCLAAMIFVIGILTNLCSLMTFTRPTPRKFGVGYYLLIVTCLNQISLFFLLFKFIEITLGSLGIGSCRAVSYSLSVFTRSTYWFTSWISVDRLLITIFLTSSFLKNARLAMIRILVTLVIIFGVHVHETIYYTVIEDLSTASLICVTNFDTVFISTYNRVSTLIHYICPFFIQIISITLLIVLATRSRSKTAGKKMSFGQILKKQFLSQKELYVTPTIFIVCALPQMILTFSFACTQLSDWQRHALLVSYILSYIPQVLGFILYVIPSSTYMKEFSETMLVKKCFKCMLGR